MFLTRNGAEGLLACRKLLGVVISDVDVPGLSGPEVLDAMRGRRKLMISGNNAGFNTAPAGRTDAMAMDCRTN